MSGAEDVPTAMIHCMRGGMCSKSGHLTSMLVVARMQVATNQAMWLSTPWWKTYESCLLLQNDWWDFFLLTKCGARAQVPPLACTMAPSLVAAYASDSDDDEQPAVAHPVQGAYREAQESQKAPERSSEKVPKPSGLALPPPKSRAPQGKRQIHIDLEPVQEDAAPAEPKRPRMEAREGGHGLLSMLPAPQSNKPLAKSQQDDARPENSVDDDMRLSIRDDGKSNNAQGNEDFRAMLGLAPKPARKEQAKPVVVQAPSHSAYIPQDTHTPSTSSDPPQRNTASHLHVSAAPEVDAKKPEPLPEQEYDLAAMYPGWRCDPDGSWYPVTPEAHAQYAAWIQHAEAESQAQTAYQSKSDAPPDPSRMRAFDAGQELQDAQAHRPSPPANKKPKVEWQISEKLQSERLTNMRARNRGQLSSLLMQAAENREMLEERWAYGKSKRREASKRYGF